MSNLAISIAVAALLLPVQVVFVATRLLLRVAAVLEWWASQMEVRLRNLLAETSEQI